MAKKTLLQNARIYDGTGAEPMVGDVLICGERIVEVGSGLESDDARVIDLDGLSLAPGFIDAHSHNDWLAIKKQPRKYFDPFVRQGITSFVAGNCGLSAAGFEHGSAHLDRMGGGLFSLEAMSGTYATLDEFFAAIDGSTPMNMAMLTGHCSARTSVVGYENRGLSDEELRRLLGILEDGLQAGGCGVSLGLMYEPGIYAPIDELRAVAELCERYDAPLTVHARAYTATSMAYANPLGRPHNLRALDELRAIAQGTKLKLQYSHAVMVGRRTLASSDKVIAHIDAMKASGIDVMFDIFAADFGVSVITTIMPAWYQAMSAAEKRKPANKALFTALVAVTKRLLGFGFDNMLIADAGEQGRRFEGKTVAQIAHEENTSDIDAYLMLCEVSDYKGRIFMSPYNTTELTSTLSRHDLSLYMTDSWVEDHGVQYRSIYDCMPTFLHWSLVGSGADMPTTIRKMSGAVADRFSLVDRGYVRPGCFADLTVFDEDALRIGTPNGGEPFGIEKVWINGALVLDGDTLDEAAFATSGRALRVAR